MEEKEKLNLLRKTDRSNISSSNSEIDKIRDEIWNKEELEFNHEHLSLVKENEHHSEDNNRSRDFEDDEDADIKVMEEKIGALLEENHALKLEISQVTSQLAYTTVQAKEF